MSRHENRAMFDTIKQRAPFRLRDIPRLAPGLNRYTFNEWSAGRRAVPDEAFPAIADALEQKAADLRELAAEIRATYPPDDPARQP